MKNVSIREKKISKQVPEVTKMVCLNEFLRAIDDCRQVFSVCSFCSNKNI